MSPWIVLLPVLIASFIHACGGPGPASERPGKVPTRTTEPAPETGADGPPASDDARPDQTPDPDNPAEDIPDETGDETNNDDPTDAPDDDSTDALAALTEERLKATLTHLASDQFAGRGSGDAGNEAAADFIIETWTKAGLQPANKGKWRQTFTINGGKRTANIMGVLPGNDPALADEVIILGAHMDHLGTSRSFIYNGADDNASGTTGLLHLAEVAVAAAPARTLVFIAFSGEELGLLGSRHYVDNPVFPLEDTLVMINMDMIGYSNGRVQAMGALAAAGVAARLRELHPDDDKLQIQMTRDSGGRSDHAPFAKLGIPVTAFHTGTHANYHKPGDTWEKIDYPGLTRIVRLVGGLMLQAGEEESFGESLRAGSRFQPGFTLRQVFDFDAYFAIHGTCHEPVTDSFDHGLLPDQPL